MMIIYKIIFCVLIFLIPTQPLLAQTVGIDSLKSRLQNSRQDTSRIFFLCELSNKFLAYRPPLSKEYAEEALLLSQKMKFKRGEMLALNRLGEYEFRQSNYARSVELLSGSLKLAEELRDSMALAGVYRVLGNINTFGFKQYDKALKYQLLALSYYEKKKDMPNIASLYGNVTWIYAITNQNLQEAYQLAIRGVQIADSLKIDKLVSYNYNSLGLIFMKRALYDSALYYLDKSNEMASHILDRSVITYNNSIKGSIYLQVKDFKRAEKLFLEAEKESRDLNSREVLKNTYYGLAQTYEGLGNYPVSLHYHKRYNELKDSLMNWETTQKALMMEYEIDEQRREVKIAELEQLSVQANLEKKVYTLLFSVSVISLLIIILLIIRNNRQRKKVNELLLEKNNAIATQNLELKHANEIKDKLFFIIGHDLRGPLSNLKALLGMVARKEVSEAEFIMLAPQLNQHVVGINETLNNLLQWSGSQMHGWQHHPSMFYIHPVIEKVFSLFSETAFRKQISLSNQVDSAGLVFADPNQIELVLRNIIHNAIKFTSEGGYITVSSSVSEERLILVVNDTGVGMTEEQLAALFQEPQIRNTKGTKGERGTGLGLTLCREMIHANEGQIRVESKIGSGTKVYLFLKIANTSMH